MNLTGLFQTQYGNKSTGNHGAETGKAQGSGSTPSGGHIPQAVRNLRPGQTIQGEIVSRDGNEVQIRVDRDVVITARLDRDMNVAVGQNMTFEIKNNSGAQMALRPLYENLAQDANVLKALEAARLPATAELTKMVSVMMEQGMSIDKNALLDMSRLISANAGANPETIVLMKHMQLSVTPENIQQFENYQNYEHQILNSVTEILTEIPQAYQSMLQSGNGMAAADLYLQLLNLFTDGRTAAGQTEGMAGTADGHVFADLVDSGAAPADPTAGNAGNTVMPETQTGMENAYLQAKGEMSESLMESVLQGELPREAVSVKNPVSGGNLQDPAAAGPLSDGLAAEALSYGERNHLAQMLGGLGAGEDVLLELQNGTISSKQLLAEIRALLAGEGALHKPETHTLLESRELNRLVGREILQQWLIKPENVAGKREVEDFYSRLREQTARLTEALGQTAKDTPLAKSLTTMQNNIDFMNQINQLFNYIQLPLKMSGGNAHGDLYVYTNRKNALLKEDGSVSALLHLDMQHLGPLDVYVVMLEKNVSTKFYFAEESMIDFAADHISLLDERLKKRGYSLQAEMLVSENTESGRGNVMETLTAADKKEALLAQYSFDVRA